MEPGKLFIGGISWDTNEDKLKEYFQAYGEVVEAVIMKDRATGRARGFGFVMYADPAVAERVVRQKHMIDDRVVEAKKAVPRDDQHILNGNSSNPVTSPIPTRTKKIFVGGLASTVTEEDLKRYFSQFGIINDVVVKYDHNTQRPRGFGFITYDSEEAVDRTLIKRFHVLNGKMVEVKRAVPKESSPPGPIRSPLGSDDISGFYRVINFLNGFPHVFNPGPIGDHSVKFDQRRTQIPFAPSGSNYEPRISQTVNMPPKLNFEQGSNTRNCDIGTGSNLGSSSWSLWGNGNINIELDAPKNTEPVWGPSPNSVQSSARTLSNRHETLNLGSMAGLYGRDIGARAPPSSSTASLDGGFDSKFDDLYTDGGEQSWMLGSLGLKESGSFEFADVSLKNPAGLCW